MRSTSPSADHAQNARAVGRDIEAEDWDHESKTGFYSMQYDPRPVSLLTDYGPDFGGIDTCRYVFLAAQKALMSLDKRLLYGLRSKAETALTLMPMRALPHVHAIANGPDDDPRRLAEELKAETDRSLEQHADHMQKRLWARVRVFRLLTRKTRRQPRCIWRRRSRSASWRRRSWHGPKRPMPMGSGTSPTWQS
jgi:hypothetical protein